VSQAAVTLGAHTSVPVIDFAGYTNGDSAARMATALSLRQALADFGFLYLRNHGVPVGVVDAVFDRAVGFFALPEQAKRQAGEYTAPGYRALDPSQPADYKEAIRARFGTELSAADWPAEPAGFRDAVLAFRELAWRAGHAVMQALAVSFGLPEDYFDAPHEPPAGSALLLHYPPLTGDLLPGQARAGAHTDFGTITLVFHYKDAGGLEIQRPDGTWLAAPCLPDACIVNAGDLLQRWTNDEVRSVLHRVVAPAGEAAARSRYSAVLFYQPQPAALITCLEPCQAPDRPAKYAPIAAGEHIQGKRRATSRRDYA
jgi:isopenicillin N synthase-like dioxygenase